MDDVVFLIGRALLVALPIHAGATTHFQADVIGYARARGVPMAHLAVPLSGAAFIPGGISVILGAWADLGALLVAATLLVITVSMHSFWRYHGDERLDNRIHFWKNAAMIGGLLLVAWIYTQSDDAPMSLTEGAL